MSSADSFLQRATAYLEDGRDMSQDAPARYEALDASRAALLDARRARAPPASLLPIFAGILSVAGKDSSPIVRIVVPHVIEEFCFRDLKSFVPPATPFLLRALHDGDVLVAKRAVRAVTTLFRRLVGFAVSVGVGDAFPESRLSEWMQMKEKAMSHIQAPDDGLRKAATKFAETVVLAFSFSGGGGASSEHFTLEYAAKRRPDSPLLNCAKLEKEGVQCVRAVTQLIFDGLDGSLVTEKPDDSPPTHGIPPGSFMTAITVLSNLVRRRPKLIEISLPSLLSVVAAITANSCPPSRAFFALSTGQQLSIVSVLRISLLALRGFAHTRPERYNSDINAALTDLSAYEREQDNRKKERAAAMAQLHVQKQQQNQKQYQSQQHQYQHQQHQQQKLQSSPQPRFPPGPPHMLQQPGQGLPYSQSFPNAFKPEPMHAGSGPPGIPRPDMFAHPMRPPIEPIPFLQGPIPPHLQKRPRGPGLAMQMGPRLPAQEAFALSQTFLQSMPPLEVVNFIMTRLLLNTPTAESVPGAAEAARRSAKRLAAASDDSSAKRLKRSRFGTKSDADRTTAPTQPVKKPNVRKVAPPVVPVNLKPDASEKLAVLCCRRVLTNDAQARASGATALRLQLLGRILTSLVRKESDAYKAFCEEVCDYIVKNLDKGIPLARSWLHCLAVSDGTSQFALKNTIETTGEGTGLLKSSKLPSQTDKLLIGESEIEAMGPNSKPEASAQKVKTVPEVEAGLQVDKQVEKNKDVKADTGEGDSSSAKVISEKDPVKDGNLKVESSPVKADQLTNIVDNQENVANKNELMKAEKNIVANSNGENPENDISNPVNTEPMPIDSVNSKNIDVNGDLRDAVENAANGEGPPASEAERGSEVTDVVNFNEGEDSVAKDSPEECEDAEEELKVSADYIKVFRNLVIALRDLVNIDANPFGKLISEAPVVPDEILEVVEGMAKNAATTRLGLQTLALIAIDRPGKDRDKSLSILMNLSLDDDDAVRGQTVRLVSNKLFVEEKGEIAQKIEESVIGALNFSVKEVCISTTAETKLRLERVSSSMMSLCGQKHELIRHIAGAYVEVPSVGKEMLIKKAREIAMHLGAGSEPLLAFIRGELLPLKPIAGHVKLQTDGAEDMAAEVLKALVRKFGVTYDGVVGAGVRRFELCGNVEVFITVLAGVEREYILTHLSTIVEHTGKTTANERDAKKKKNIASSQKALGPKTNSTFQDVISKLTSGKEWALSPADLLIELHKIKATEAVSKAILACFEYKTVFKQEVIAQAVQQLIELTDVPDMFMRTVMLARVWHPDLEDYLTETVMKRLIEKRVWTKRVVWNGFLRYCLEIKEKSAVKLLLSLPATQLEDALRTEGLSAIFRELTKSKNASKIGSKHRKVIAAALKRGVAKRK